MQSNGIIHKKLLNEESKALLDLINDILDHCEKQNDPINLPYPITPYHYEFHKETLIRIKKFVSNALYYSTHMDRASWSKNKTNLFACIHQCNIDNPARVIAELQDLFPAVVEKRYFQSIVESGNSLGLVQFLERPSVRPMMIFEMICMAANQGYTQIVITMLPFCISIDQAELGAQNIKAGLIETFLKTRPNDRLDFLLNSVRQLIANNTKTQINSVLNELNLQLKEKLFESCIGKLSYQGFQKKSKGIALEINDQYYHSRKYRRGYSELYFLSQAVFTLREDKRMSISNIQEYIVYEYIYAPGKAKTGLLRPELEYLFEMIGLECDEDSDFDNKIIFKPAYTQKLINLGVHYNVDYIKNLLFAQNRFRLLNKSWHAQENNTGENTLKRMPLELVSLTLFPSTIKKNLTSPARILDKSDVDRVTIKKAEIPKFVI